MRAQAASRLVFVVVLASLLLSPSTDAYPLQANLAPADLIRTSGNFSSAPADDTRYLIDGSRLTPSPETPFFTAPNGSFEILEFRWKTFEKEVGGMVVQTSTENMSTWETHYTSMQDVRVFLEDVGPDATFAGSVTNGHFPGTIDLGPALDCRVATPRLKHLVERPPRAHSPSSLDSLAGVLPRLWGSGGSSGRHELTAACETDSFRLVNNTGMWIYGVVLRLDYTDPDTQRPASLRFEGGRVLSPPGPDGFQNGALRWGILNAWDPVSLDATVDPRFELKGPMRVDLVSRAFLFAARLDLPASKGALRWGDLIESDPAMNRTPNGAFVIRATGEDSVWIDGESVDAPPAVPRSAPAPDASAMGVAIMIAFGGVAALGALWKFRHLWVALGTRLTRDEALRNPLRRAILDLVRARPGVRLHEVVQQVKGTRGATEHHVQALRRLGLVWPQRLGAQTQLFPARPPDARQAAVEELVRRPTHDRVLARIRQDPRRSQGAIARELGVSQSYVSRVLRQLAAAGVVRIVVLGRRREYRVSGPKAA